MSQSFDRAVSALLAGAAVVVALSFGYRTFYPVLSVPSGLHVPARRLDSREWEAALAASITLQGTRAAPVTILEFADLECTACAAFQSVVDGVISRHGDDVHVAMVHFPLPRHRFAMHAARAFECADSLGRGIELLRTIYSTQDSLGLVGWGELARRSGIADTNRVRDCAMADVVPARVAAGRSLAKSLRISGTPTVFVNRWEFGVPTATLLDSVVTSLSIGPR
jgi:protein-disulfide isomerase